MSRHPFAARRMSATWFAAAALLATLVGAPLSAASAQEYPNHPITLIVPYPPGGAPTSFASKAAAANHVADIRRAANG